MTTTFLTDIEIQLLTGYKQPSKQVTRLREMGLFPTVNRAGKPILTRAALEQSQLGKPRREDQRNRPNFDSIFARGNS